MLRDGPRVRPHQLSIWQDDDWRDLSPLARYLYFTLLTSATLSHCGVADWRPARIAALNGMTAGEVEHFGAELIEALYLVVDEGSEEVLIRSFIRNDGLMKQPKMAVAMASAHGSVASQGIRGVIVHELNRLREDYPNLSGWGSEKASELLRLRSVDPSTYGSERGPEKISRPLAVRGAERGPILLHLHLLLTTFLLVAICRKPLTRLRRREDVDRSCERLAEHIEANGGKRPAITKGWRDAARLLIDRDGRTEDEAARLIDWCQRDESGTRTCVDAEVPREVRPARTQGQAHTPRRPSDPLPHQRHRGREGRLGPRTAAPD